MTTLEKPTIPIENTFIIFHVKTEHRVGQNGSLLVEMFETVLGLRTSEKNEARVTME